MAGSQVDFELRKLPIIDGDSPNFESVTYEHLKTIDKPIKLQKLAIRNNILYALELYFSNGLDSAAYQTTSFSSSN